MVDWNSERAVLLDTLRAEGIHLHGHLSGRGTRWHLFRGVNNVGHKYVSEFCTAQNERCFHITNAQRKLRLPVERASTTHKVTVYSEYGDADVFIIAGRYPDGRVGEVFANIGLQGSTLRGTLDAWARMVSVALQWGVPLADIIDKFKGVAFEPSGRTSNPAIPHCNSVIDYVVRWLEQEEANAPRM